MTRKELKSLKEVESNLREARKIVKRHERGTEGTGYCDSLDHADTLFLLAECGVSHLVFVKETEKW